MGFFKKVGGGIQKVTKKIADKVDTPLVSPLISGTGRAGKKLVSDPKNIGLDVMLPGLGSFRSASQAFKEKQGEMAAADIASAELAASEQSAALEKQQEDERVKAIMEKREELRNRRARTPGRPVFTSLLNSSKSLLG